MNGRLFESVKRNGFRKWYERQLLSSHAHMVLAFLSMIALVGSMEAQRQAEDLTQLVDVLFVLLCALIGLWALRRYLFLLTQAEETANQASCPDCGDYGRFRPVCERVQAIDVCCRKCSRHWVITTPK
ncbi:MAG: hypothetical protein ACYC0T_00110 [Ramlibacter sp.]